jgi:ketosteroid isomerase-like protein
MNPLLERFRDFYRELERDSIANLGEIYRQDVEFCDPVHCIQGLDALRDYFAATMQNVEYCAFDISEFVEQEDRAAAVWTMRLRHPKLKHGATIEVPGASHLHFDQRIYYHRDFFDLGAMLYEHIPVLGGAVRLVKGKMAAD